MPHFKLILLIGAVSAVVSIAAIHAVNKAKPDSTLKKLAGS
jgi:hypothetical protein